MLLCACQAWTYSNDAVLTNAVIRVGTSCSCTSCSMTAHLLIQVLVVEHFRLYKAVLQLSQQCVIVQAGSVRVHIDAGVLAAAALR